MTLRNDRENELFRGYGVEVRLHSDDDFLKVRETLTRIGVASKKDRKLYQSCHILHKQGRYSIVHFKELFALDGKTFTLTEEDKGRRNAIAKLLEEWNLLTIVFSDDVLEPIVPISQIKILSFKEKCDWTCVPKYSIGKARK
jgi:hypothetical protein